MDEGRGCGSDSARTQSGGPSEHCSQSGTSEYCSPELGSETMSQHGDGASASHWSSAERDQPPAKIRKTAGHAALHDNVGLTPTQREALSRVVEHVDTDTSSLVVTNPLQPNNPIVYVTRRWEEMCGFSYDQAVGRNARLTQGAQSDPDVMRVMGGALRSQRSCKVMMLNYRGGLADRPFWNMLSISPIVHSNRLVLYLANLQDYTYHMAKLVALSPTQFCRSADHHQTMQRLQPAHPPDQQLSLRYFARPAVFETDDAAPLVPAANAAAAEPAPLLRMKRLGWSNLQLEPEHLVDRVCDALQSLDARYERAESVASGDDVFVVNTDITGVAARLLISRDPDAEGAFRITCTRLGGDTFAYHEAFRQLRQLLGDAVHGSSPLGGVNRPAGGLGLAPMRDPLTMPREPSPAMPPPALPSLPPPPRAPPSATLPELQ